MRITLPRFVAQSVDGGNILGAPNQTAAIKETRREHPIHAETQPVHHNPRIFSRYLIHFSAPILNSLMHMQDGIRFIIMSMFIL